MKKKFAASAMPKDTLQTFLERFSSKSLVDIDICSGANAVAKFATGENLIACTRHCASALVELVNAQLISAAIEPEPAAAPLVFEAVRKLAVRILAAKREAEFDFSSLVESYEELLEMRLSGEFAAYKLVESVNEKRKRGVFYTPEFLARDLTIRALLPLLTESFEDSSLQRPQASIPAHAEELVSVEKILSLRVVDPSMGAGNFLLIALDVLTDCILKRLTVCNQAEDWTSLLSHLFAQSISLSSVEALKKADSKQLILLISNAVARNCLFGVDVDAAAVELARIGFAIRCGLPSEESSQFLNLRHGNALLGLWRSSAQAEGSTIEERQLRDEKCLECFGALAVSLRDGIPAAHLAARLNFFHWDLEYAEIFSGENPGFDAVISNPPWEIEKANSREFFSRWDAEFMSLGKQAALLRQQQLIAQESSLAEEWEYCKRYHEGFKNYLQKLSALSLQNDQNQVVTPFCHQGSGDSNSYKLFLELSYFLLKSGGVVAQIVPSGIYSDKGATELRRLLIDRCRWLFLHGYHNREGLFPIHRSFKFCTLGAIKGGSTNSISCAFLRVSTERFYDKPVDYNVNLLRRLSSECLSFTEVTRAQDLQLIEKLSKSALPLSNLLCAREREGKAELAMLSFRREFDMTNDSHLFIERSSAQKSGFVRDAFGHWIKGLWRPIEKFTSSHSGEFTQSFDGLSAVAIDDIERVLLPVYEGRMIGQYDWAKKSWLRGKGRRAEWSELDFADKSILPQYTMDLSDYQSMQTERGAKLAYLAVGASTNSRSCIAAMIGDWPCGNSVPVLSMGAHHDQLCALLACLNSYVFDYLLRMRLSANNLNWFILQECLIPDLETLSRCAPLLSAVAELSNHPGLQAEGFNSACAGSAARRARLRAFVEAVVADAYAIDQDDCRLILRGCQFTESSNCSEQATSIDKGFHRIDLHLPFQFRGPYLFARSFELLQEKGLQWLFEHLDGDELFSQKHFESCKSALASSLVMRNKPLVPVGNPAELFARIRGVRAETGSLAKALKTGTVGSLH